jgi:hypothetical protein
VRWQERVRTRRTSVRVRLYCALARTRQNAAHVCTSTTVLCAGKNASERGARLYVCADKNASERGALIFDLLSRYLTMWLNIKQSPMESENPAINDLQTMATQFRTLEAEAVPRKKRGRPSTAEKEKEAALEAVRPTLSSIVTEKDAAKALKVEVAEAKSFSDFKALGRRMFAEQVDSGSVLLNNLKVKAEGECTDYHTDYINECEKHKHQKHHIETRHKREVEDLETLHTRQTHQAISKLAKAQQAESAALRSRQKDDLQQQEENTFDIFKDRSEELGTKIYLLNAEALSRWGN